MTSSLSLRTWPKHFSNVEKFCETTRELFFPHSHTTEPCRWCEKNEGQRQLTSLMISDRAKRETQQLTEFHSQFNCRELLLLYDVIFQLFPKSRVSILSSSVIWFYFKFVSQRTPVLVQRRKLMRNKQASIENIETSAWDLDRATYSSSMITSFPGRPFPVSSRSFYCHTRAVRSIAPLQNFW